MTELHDAWLARRRARWLRPNAHLYVRPDAQRFIPPDAQRFLRPDWKTHVLPEFEPVVAALLEGKANFNPSQPRVPKGEPGGGQWTDAGGSSGGGADESVLANQRPGIGHNQGPPLNDPPPVPPVKPQTTQEKFAFIKDAARWLSLAARIGTPAGAFMAAMEAASWLDTDRAYIDAYLDAPKPLNELQSAVAARKLGYHVHHVVEQSSARDRNFDEALINGADNLVRIPALKHWKITAWYGTKNPDYGGLTPREYLKDKSWEERRRVGLETLRKFEVLK